jgi:hypothetical protein
MNKGRGKKKAANGGQNKGGRPGWATPEQEEWLKSHLPNYMGSQGKGPKALVEFWPPLWEGWFDKWPEAPASTADDNDELKTAVVKRKVVSQ